MNDLTPTIPLSEADERRIKAIVTACPGNLTEAAAVLQVPIEDAKAFLALNADIIQARYILEQLSGRAAVAFSQRALRKALLNVDAELDSADGFESVELSKLPMRVLETYERARLAERESKKDLPVFHITINKGGPGPTIQVRSMDPDTLEAADVTPKVLRGDV